MLTFPEDRGAPTTRDNLNEKVACFQVAPARISRGRALSRGMPSPTTLHEKVIFLHG